MKKIFICLIIISKSLYSQVNSQINENPIIQISKNEYSIRNLETQLFQTTLSLKAKDEKIKQLKNNIDSQKVVLLKKHMNTLVYRFNREKHTLVMDMALFVGLLALLITILSIIGYKKIISIIIRKIVIKMTDHEKNNILRDIAHNADNEIKRIRNIGNQQLLEISAKLSKFEINLKNIQRDVQNSALESEVSRLMSEGFLLYNLEQYKKSISIFNKVILLKNNYYTAYFYSGLAYNDLGLYKKAIESYKMSIKLNSSDIDSYNNLIVLYTQTKQYNKALEIFSKTNNINTDDPAIHNNIGITYSYIKEYTKSLDSYKKCLQIDPTYIEALFNQVCLMALQNKFKEALFPLKKLLNMKNDYTLESFLNDPDLQEIKNYSEYEFILNNYFINI